MIVPAPMLRAVREYLRRQAFRVEHVARLLRSDDSRWRAGLVKRAEADYRAAHPGEGVPFSLSMKIWYGPHGLHRSTRSPFGSLVFTENPFWSLNPRSTT